jgi:hypothetical protein
MEVERNGDTRTPYEYPNCNGYEFGVLVFIPVKNVLRIEIDLGYPNFMGLSFGRAEFASTLLHCHAYMWWPTMTMAGHSGIFIFFILIFFINKRDTHTAAKKKGLNIIFVFVC